MFDKINAKHRFTSCKKKTTKINQNNNHDNKAYNIHAYLQFWNVCVINSSECVCVHWNSPLCNINYHFDCIQNSKESWSWPNANGNVKFPFNLYRHIHKIVLLTNCMDSVWNWWRLHNISIDEICFRKIKPPFDRNYTRAQHTHTYTHKYTQIENANSPRALARSSPSAHNPKPFLKKKVYVSLCGNMQIYCLFVHHWNAKENNPLAKKMDLTSAISAWRW